MEKTKTANILRSHNTKAKIEENTHIVESVREPLFAGGKRDFGHISSESEFCGSMNAVSGGADG